MRAPSTDAVLSHAVTTGDVRNGDASLVFLSNLQRQFSFETHKSAFSRALINLPDFLVAVVDELEPDQGVVVR